MNAPRERRPAQQTKTLYASRLADFELEHIAVVLAYLSQGREARLEKLFDYRYWRDRIDSVSLSYALIPAQRLKLDALRRLLGQLNEQ
jgi:hypothetical protein